MQPIVKKWYQSRAIWLAIAQAVLGLIIVFQTQNPTLVGIGWLAMVKSGLDFFIRLDTTTTITS